MTYPLNKLTNDRRQAELATDPRIAMTAVMKRMTPIISIMIEIATRFFPAILLTVCSSTSRNIPKPIGTIDTTYKHHKGARASIKGCTGLTR